MPDVKNIFVFELSRAQAQIGLNDAYSPSTVLSNQKKGRIDSKKHLSLKNVPNPLLLTGFV